MTVGTPVDSPAPDLPPPPDSAARARPRLLPMALVMVLVLCWAAIALTALGVLATMAGFTLSPLHAVFQMALPWVVVALALPFFVSVLTRRRALAIASGALLVTTAVLVLPAALPGDAPPASPDDLSIFVTNFRYNNDRPDQKIDQILHRDDDVLVIIELTPGFLALLDDGGIADTHPYRFTEPLWGAHGAGIFSKTPLVDAHTEPIGGLNAPAATVQTPDGPLRVVAVHTRPPVTDEYLPVWHDDLDALQDYTRSLQIPSVLAGDYNSTRWHPAFRDLLDLGLQDAHEQLGQGLSFSWPEAGRVGAVLPPFSRLDHALLFDTDATEIEELPAAGSDHTAFSVRVRPRPASTVDP